TVWSAHDFAKAIACSSHADGALVIDRDRRTLAFVSDGGAAVFVAADGLWRETVAIAHAPSRLFVIDGPAVAEVVSFSESAARTLVDVRIADHLVNGMRRPDVPLMTLVAERYPAMMQPLRAAERAAP